MEPRNRTADPPPRSPLPAPLEAADLPYLAPLEGHAELVAGALVREPPPGAEHGWIAGRLLVHLGRHVLEHRLGRIYAAETGFVLARGPDTVRCPDAAFVAAHRLREARHAGPYLVGAPDLAVEVASPRDSARELAAKAAEYLAAGGRAVWIVDPRLETVVVHAGTGAARVLGHGDLLDGAPVLPGLRLPVATLFDG